MRRTRSLSFDPYDIRASSPADSRFTKLTGRQLGIRKLDSPAPMMMVGRGTSANENGVGAFPGDDRERRRDVGAAGAGKEERQAQALPHNPTVTENWCEPRVVK